MSRKRSVYGEGNYAKGKKRAPPVREPDAPAPPIDEPETDRDAPLEGSVPRPGRGPYRH